MDPFDPPAVYDDLSTSTLPSQPPLLSRCFGAPVVFTAATFLCRRQASSHHSTTGASPS